MIISIFFLENLRPIFGQKSKNVPKCGVVALFMQDYFNLYTKNFWDCKVLSFCPFLKILKVLWINVAYFLNRLFNAHL